MVDDICFTFSYFVWVLARDTHGLAVEFLELLPAPVGVCCHGPAHEHIAAVDHRPDRADGGLSKDYRRTRSGEILGDVQELLDDEWGQARGNLVQVENGRVCNESPRDGQHLLH